MYSLRRIAIVILVAIAAVVVGTSLRSFVDSLQGSPSPTSMISRSTTMTGS